MTPLGKDEFHCPSGCAPVPVGPQAGRCLPALPLCVCWWWCAPGPPAAADAAEAGWICVAGWALLLLLLQQLSGLTSSLARRASSFFLRISLQAGQGAAGEQAQLLLRDNRTGAAGILCSSQRCTSTGLEPRPASHAGVCWCGLVAAVILPLVDHQPVNAAPWLQTPGVAAPL